MKLQVTQENLNRALSSVARVASSRGTLPILANVLIKTSHNRLSLAATNLDIAITHYIGAKVGEEGSITVPARLMQDFVSSLPNGIISIELKGTKLQVITDQYKSTINGIVADDFPVMPAITDGKNWTIPSNVLRRGLQQVVFAASSDETRPVLTGVLLHTIDGKLHLAATDSYRLGEKVLATNNEAVNLLIPATAMHDLLRILSDDDQLVKISHDDQQVLFRVGDIELVTRLLEGKFPDYQRLIPKQLTTTAILKRSDFVNVTKVSSLFARESAGSVTIAVDETSQTLSIHSVASQLGENNATAAAKTSGTASITLNSRYLLDALNAFSSEEVSFGFNGKLEATMMQDPTSSDYLHIISPLQS